MALQKHLKQVAFLWYLGLRESLKVHRCVVLLVLDEEHLLWAKVWQLLQLHGAIFMGSMLWWQYAVQPMVSWLLTHSVQPLLGPSGSYAMMGGLAWLHQALWMMPVYVVTVMVSCTWYNELAQRAVAVRRKHTARLAAEKQQQQQLQAQVAPSGTPQHGSRPAAPRSMSGGASSSGTPYETAAEELYRVVLFLVLYLEVILVGFVPGIGKALYLVLSCWLYAYYCYDYQWALQGMRVQDRLALFEGCAPFFAGYGLILAVVTLLPFYLGGALFSLLFPVFIMVACESDVADVMYAVVRPKAPTATAAAGAAAANGMSSSATEGHQHGLMHAQGVQRGAPPWQPSGAGQHDEHGAQHAPSERGSQRSAQRVVHFRVPVFALAAWPTQWVLRLVFKASTGPRKVR